MVSFVQQTIIFLAGVSLVVSVPVDNLQKTENQISSNQEEDRDPTKTSQVDLGNPNAVDVLDAVSSIAELSDEQRSKLQKPLTKLIKTFEGTLFGSLFTYMLKALQNPTDLETAKANNAELLEKTPLALKSLISTLQQLDDEVITNSKTQFDEIFEILGTARFAIMFREIFTILQMRQDLFQYADMGAMLKSLPNMLANASKTGNENVQELIQNQGAIAALMPNLTEMKSPNLEGVQTPTPSSEKNLISQAAETVNAAKNMASRLRLNSVPSVQRIDSMQRRMRTIPTFKPEILGGPKGTMAV